MDMIKKIALTASTMLFVLAQIFSFYVIYASQQEKIELLKKQEEKVFSRGLSGIASDINKLGYANLTDDHIMTYCFRKNMPEGSALYKNGEELHNNSSFEFDTDKVKIEQDTPPMYAQEKIDGSHLLIFCSEDKRQEEGKRVSYLSFYVVDITYIYQESFRLAVQEVLVSVLASFAMALLLIFLIKKITRPLEATNEAQRQLIGSMSHELKTPLTAIKGYSETLLSVKLTKEQEEKALNYINRESGRLSRLSEKMMELTRLYEPECRILLQEVSLDVLFEGVRENVRHRLSESSITLIVEPGYEGRTMNLDMDLMTSFLINLINNSIMASEPGSHIYMGAGEQSLWVRDEGCGIPPAEIEKVRKAFYRVDKSRSRKSGNMGLGLALCEQIAKAHHGRMEIESEVGRGTKISWVKESRVYESFTTE